jgi:methyl-accepting chemotaxis protein
MVALDLTAQAVAPGAAQTWIPAALTALATALVGYLVYRNARRANNSSERDALTQSQLEWTRQAMAEAKEAKEDARQAVGTAREASAAADSATRRAEDAEKRLSEVTDLTGKLMDWIGRVVRKAHQVDHDESTPADVRDLLRAINGGPPELSTSRLHSGG